MKINFEFEITDNITSTVHNAFTAPKWKTAKNSKPETTNYIIQQQIKERNANPNNTHARIPINYTTNGYSLPPERQSVSQCN
jgi:hypothetical protein